MIAGKQWYGPRWFLYLQSKEWRELRRPGRLATAVFTISRGPAATGTLFTISYNPAATGAVFTIRRGPAAGCDHGAPEGKHGVAIICLALDRHYTSPHLHMFFIMKRWAYRHKVITGRNCKMDRLDLISPGAQLQGWMWVARVVLEWWWNLHCVYWWW